MRVAHRGPLTLAYGPSSGRWHILIDGQTVDQGQAASGVEALRILSTANRVHARAVTSALDSNLAVAPPQNGLVAPGGESRPPSTSTPPIVPAHQTAQETPL